MGWISVQASANRATSSLICITSRSLKRVLKEDLMTEPIMSAKDGNKRVNPHSEVRDLVVDCLLLVVDYLLLVIDRLLL